MSTLPGTKKLDQFLELDIKDIYPNPNQPRKNFLDIEELAQTIKYYGLIHPITVVKDNNKYMIVSGERRYKAHLLNKEKTIKAHILDIDDFQLRELVLIENIQRDDLTDFEKAKYIGSLWATGLYKKKQHLSTALGKSPSYISKCFSCLKLDPTIIESLEKDLVDIPLSVLEEISRVKDKNLQCEIYDKYTVKEITRDEIKDYELEKFPAGKKEEIQQIEEPNNNTYISYGFGTQNHLGTYISICDGVFTGTIEFEDNKELIKHSNNKNYRITIEEISDQNEESTDTNIKEVIEETIADPKEELEKEIKLIEVFETEVYIEYTDFDSDTFSHNKAKNLIKSSTTESIKYTIHGGSDKAFSFINKMPYRSQVNGYLILKEKDKK